MKQLYLLKLHRGSCYLPPIQKDRTLSPTSDPQNIESWWTNGKEEFRKMVLEKKTKDYDIEAVCIIIAKLPDVTIFSHEYNERWNKHTNPQVIANEDIKEIIPLTETTRTPEAGGMVCARWIDASHNNTPATIEEVSEDSKGVMDIVQLGFFMHENEERIFIGGRYNAENKKYRYLAAIPTINITSMKTLSV